MAGSEYSCLMGTKPAFNIPYILVINCQIKLKFVLYGYFKVLFQNPKPKVKYSRNRIFVTSHFGSLFSLRPTENKFKGYDKEQDKQGTLHA